MSPLRFTDLTPAARSLWAKSGEPSGHSLLAHMLDVAAVTETILRLESKQTLEWAARSLGMPRENARRWCAMVARLHDFGKAVPGFQYRWDKGRDADKSAGLPFKPAALMRHCHEHAGTALLRRLLPSRSWESAWIRAITQVVGAHHGYMPNLTEVKDAHPRHEGPGWADARNELLDAYLQVLAPGVALGLDHSVFFSGTQCGQVAHQAIRQNAW